MKKRILSIIVLSLLVLSVLSLSACGKGGEETKLGIPDSGLGQEINPDGTIKPLPGTPIFSQSQCISEDCDANVSQSDLYCSNCGASQVECPECSDGEIDGVYCTRCGRQVQKDGKMKFKLDFGALGESAMILCKGMLGIFIVTGVIIAFILILNTVVEKVKQSKENKQ